MSEPKSLLQELEFQINIQEGKLEVLGKKVRAAQKELDWLVYLKTLYEEERQSWFRDKLTSLREDLQT